MMDKDFVPDTPDFEMPKWLEALAQDVTPLSKKRDAPSISEVLEGPGGDDGALAQPPRPRRTRSRCVAEANWILPGFGPMTRISTSFGAVPAQALRERDLVRTRSGDYRPIRWIDRMVLDADFLASVPSAQPILIRAGAFGQGVPSQDVYVSPGQFVAPGNTSGPPAYKTAAQHLERPAVHRKPEQIFTYTRFHCGEPIDVQVDGLWMRVEVPQREE